MVIESTLKECITKRKLTQPSQPSAGSVFKRYGEIAAGLLIDEAGLKGVRVGGCEVSTKHANFIVNTGNGTAEDFKTIVSIIQAEVQSKYNIKLDREIEYI